MNITAVVLTKNEEKNITECLKTLQWCDEILLIDDNSTDKTISLAEKIGATVIKHALNDDFSQQRNFALEKAKNDWVFFVDADERVTKELEKEIKKTLEENPRTTAFYIKRDDFMWGKLLKHGETSRIYLLRLAKKDTGLWYGKVHESWVSNTKAGELTQPLYHYPHVTIAEFLDDINYYSTLRAQELYQQGKTANWFTIILYPKAKFFHNYLLRLGLLDGVAGLVFAIMMSFHSFLVRGKLWLLIQKKKKA